MLFVTIAYFLSSVAVGGAKLVSGQTMPGIAFLLAALFGFWSGAAFKIAIFAPSTRPRVVSGIIGTVFIGLALLVTALSGVRFEAYGQDLHGAAWAITGVIAGLMGTRKRRAGKPI
ncbi:MAG: hypothetical protein K2X62_03120 [Beijerinckiaceae bacterium]|nr:hypothetical protein [Beijerinckiaceae bacterium]MDO9443396.1 hypothetical protein [Beijerinckiaceae bacterium]